MLLILTRILQATCQYLGNPVPSCCFLWVYSFCILSFCKAHGMNTTNFYWEQWSLIWPYLPRVQIFWAKFSLSVTVLKLGELHQPCSWPYLSIWTTETCIVYLYGLATTHNASHLHRTCPWISDIPSVAECTVLHTPSATWRLAQKLIATSLVEVCECLLQTWKWKRTKIAFASLHGATAASPCRGCSLCTRPAADFN